MNPVILYKLTNTNLLTWAISCSHNKVVIEHGVYRGKQQVDVNEFATPDQADTEMQRRIAIKKTKQGYTTYIPSSIPDLPMLASKYDPSKLPNDVYIQPKLDGIRCVGSNSVLLTRRGETITSMPHINHALSTLPPGIKLDGELYCHGKSFQEHLSIIKRDSPHLYAIQIQYHVFDIQLSNVPYTERYQALFEIVDKLDSPFIVPVRTKHIPKTEIPVHAKQHFSTYEGAILRDPANLYEYNHRSSSLQKYKWTETAECKIVDITAPKTGRAEGAAILHCQHPETNQVFKAVPAMSIYLRQSMYENKDGYIGQWAKVTYESLSTKGVPLKPRAVAIAYRIEDLQ
jgi:DNA ligase 1